MQRIRLPVTGFGIKADPIVFNDQYQGPIDPFEDHRYALGGRVLYDVIQRFLRDPINLGLYLRVQTQVLNSRTMKISRLAVVPRPFRDKGLQGRYEPEFVECLRTQLPGKKAYLAIQKSRDLLYS